MTKNFRKRDHTRANEQTKLRRCPECGRHLPRQEFIETRKIRRRIMWWLGTLQGPKYRVKTIQNKTCSVCRSHSSWSMTTAILKDNRYRQYRTPLVQVGGRFIYG